MNTRFQGSRKANFTIVSCLGVLSIAVAACGGTTSIVVWGDYGRGQTNVPPDLTNAVSLSAGGYHTVALREDGTVAAWGDSAWAQTRIPSGLSNVVSVAAGCVHSLALRADGTVVAWGYGANGQTNVPGNLTNVAGIAAGQYHNLALKRDGTVIGWGASGGVRINCGQAMVPGGLSNTVATAAGSYHSLALSADGTVVAWGAGTNDSGYDYNYGQSMVPGDLTEVVAIAAGQFHSLAVKADGTIVAWGRNDLGQAAPVPGTNTVAVAAGWSHNLRLDGGAVVGWGSNSNLQTAVPAGLTLVMGLGAGVSHSVALSSDGAPGIVRQPYMQASYIGWPVTFSVVAAGEPPLSYQWLFNDEPIIGETNAALMLQGVQTLNAGSYSVVISNAWGRALSRSAALAVLDEPPIILIQPTNQTARRGETVRLVSKVVGTRPMAFQWKLNGTDIPGATQQTFTLPAVQLWDAGSYRLTVSNALATTSSLDAVVNVQPVIAWGAGLTTSGNGPDYGQCLVPPDLTGAQAVAAGAFHSLALQADGRVLSWGMNSYQLTNVAAVLTNAAAISAGQNFSCALRKDGSVVAWGDGLYGDTTVPAAATNVAAIACGWYHGLALGSNGTVVAWGAGRYISGLEPQSGQAQVPANLVGVSGIAAGAYHSLALRTNGTVVAWGSNTRGQTAVPTGLSNVVAIAAGASNSMALKNNGTVVTWGDTVYGRPPPGLSNVVAIAAGMAHNMALLSDGTLVGWGLNANGQAAVPFWATNIVTVSAGAYHTLAIQNLGQVAFIGAPIEQTVYRGSDVKVSAPCLGDAPITYQWLHNGTNVPNAIDPVLSITNVQIADGGTYRLVASNAFGTATSRPSTLNVMESAPSFSQPLRGRWVIENSQATFTVALNGLPPFRYEWRFNGSAIPGATNSTYSIPRCQLSNEGYYSVVVSNLFGSALSSEAFLDVVDFAQALGPTNLVWLNDASSPWIIEPQGHDGIAGVNSGTVVYPSSSRLQTVVAGPGRISFWWWGTNATMSFYVDGAKANQLTPSGWNRATFYLGAGSHVLTWEVTSSSWSSYKATGYLDEVVFDSGPASPAIEVQPKGQTNSAGSNVTFTVQAIGTPPLRYRWYFNGSPLAGQTASRTTLNNVQAVNAGDYHAVVSNDYGSEVSAPATLTVLPAAPMITRQPTSLLALLGGRADLTGSALGSAPLAYQWARDGVALQGCTGTTLSLTNLQLGDYGAYTLLITNPVGWALSSNAYLIPYSVLDLAGSLDNTNVTWSTTDMPWFPQTNVTHDGVAAAQSGLISDKKGSTLTAVLEGPATVTYWWKVNCDSFWVNLAVFENGVARQSIGGNLDWQQATNLIGPGPQTLQWKLYAIHQAFAGGTGWVDQVQFFPGGTAASVSISPISTTNKAGDNGTFTALASGTSPRFQWRFSGTELPGATNSVLSLYNLQAANAGTYEVVVTNEYGPAASASCNLTVLPAAPTIIQQSRGQSQPIGGAAVFSVSAKGSAVLRYQWRRDGRAITGATDSALTLASLSVSNNGSYAVVVTNDFGAVTSAVMRLDVQPTAVMDFPALPVYGTTPPPGIGRLTAIAVGDQHFVGLRPNGTVVPWDAGGRELTNVPAGLSSVIAITAGANHSVALKADGTVIAWGDNFYGQLLVPPGLSDVIAVASSGGQTLALRNNELVVGWGANDVGQINTPADLANVVSVAAGTYNCFAVLENGTVRQWGNQPAGDGWPIPVVAPGDTDVLATAAGTYSAWSLHNNGTVRSWGWLGGDQYPDTVAIAAGAGPRLSILPRDFVIGLRLDGTVYTAGTMSDYLPKIPAGLSNVIAIAAGYGHAAVLVNDGSPCAIGSGLNQTRTRGSTAVLFPGIVGPGLSYQWRYNGENIPGATAAFLGITNLTIANAGVYDLVASNVFGIVTNQPATLSVQPSPPRIQTDSGFGLAGGQFSFNVIGDSGMTGVVESSTNLVNWEPVGTNVLVNGHCSFSIPQSGQERRRFYRVRGD